MEGAQHSDSNNRSKRELFPIMVAAMVWGNEWHGLTVRANCDNSAVVDVINRQSAKDALLCRLMRCLFFACAHFDMTVVSQGIHNGAADVLSRDNIPSFFTQVPFHSSTPSHIPRDLLRGLATEHSAWTSHEWKMWFSTIMVTL